jgi:hypothetical protein
MKINNTCFPSENNSFLWKIEFTNHYKVMPQLRQQVTSFPPQQPVFDPRSGQVGFVVDSVALGQIFS